MRWAVVTARVQSQHAPGTPIATRDQKCACIRADIVGGGSGTGTDRVIVVSPWLCLKLCLTKGTIPEKPAVFGPSRDRSRADPKSTKP
jgi:hypothetical protein